MERVGTARALDCAVNLTRSRRYALYGRALRGACALAAARTGAEMSDRDWNKEREDRQGSSRSRTRRSSDVAAATTAARGRRSRAGRTSSWGAIARLAIVVILGIAFFWPTGPERHGPRGYLRVGVLVGEGSGAQS